MPEYDVRDSAGNLVGKFIPADSGLVGFFIGLVLVVTVGVFLIGGWLIFHLNFAPINVKT